MSLLPASAFGSRKIYWIWGLRISLEPQLGEEGAGWAPGFGFPSACPEAAEKLQDTGSSENTKKEQILFFPVVRGQRMGDVGERNEAEGDSGAVLVDFAC